MPFGFMTCNARAWHALHGTKSLTEVARVAMCVTDATRPALRGSVLMKAILYSALAAPQGELHIAVSTIRGNAHDHVGVEYLADVRSCDSQRQRTAAWRNVSTQCRYKCLLHGTRHRRVCMNAHG